MFQYWLRFNAIGMIGFAVQLALLAVLMRLGAHYLIATPLAVEAAVLHNFLWHERWTWRERGVGLVGRAERLLRFHTLNGLVSVVGNLAMMWMLVGVLGIPAVPANLVAVIVCSTINFIAGHKLVWVNDGLKTRPAARPRTSDLEPRQDTRRPSPVAVSRLHPLNHDHLGV